MPTKQKPLNTSDGHRKRLRNRFKKHPDSLADYEILEALLFLALPRCDTKKIAKHLLHEHSSLANLLNSAPYNWKKMAGIGDQAAHVLSLMQHIHTRLLRDNFKKEKCILNNEKLVAQYCRAKMAYDVRERVWLLFLNKSHTLLEEEEHEVGTIDACAVFPREVIRRALDIGANGIVMVHNHPSGDPRPSTTDILLTESLKEVCQNLNLHLLDHIIITTDDFVSLRKMELI